MVLTIDELRALRRIVGVWLPRFVTEDDEEDLRVDLAALRGLAARALLTSPAADEDAVISPALAAALAPFRDPTLVVEAGVVEAGVVEAEQAADGRTNWCAAGQARDRELSGVEHKGVMAWHGPGLVRMELVGPTVADATARLCGIHLVTTVVDGDELVIDPDVHLDADELALAGERDASVAALVAGGASETTAQAWVAAVASRRRSVAVTVAHRIGERLEAGELRWLVAGDGTAWRATLRELPPLARTAAADSAIEAARMISVVAPMGGRDLRRHLDELFLPARGVAR